MKKLLLALLALVPVIAFGQSPILRNNITTNAFAPTTNVVVLSSTAGPVGITTTSTNAFLMKRGVGFTFVNANTNAWAFNGTENFLPKWLTPDTLGNSRSLDDGAILSLASNGSNLTGITNSTDVVGIGDFALDGLVTDGSLNIYGIGPSALSGVTLAPSSGQIFAYGESALSGANLTNATHIYAFGESAGTFMTGDSPSDIYMIGNSALGSSFFTNGSSTITAIGNNALNSATMDGSGSVFALGDNALGGVLLTNASTIFGFGSSAGQNMAGSMSEVFAVGVSAADTLTGDSGSEIYAYGSHAMHDVTLTNSPTGIYMFGKEAGALAHFDGGSHIYGFGQSALLNASLTNSSDIYVIGSSTASGTLSHVFVAGSGAVATANNQWVAGDSAYTYHFPGAYMTLNSQTNQISDNGTALTYNGVAVGGSGSGVSTTVTPLAYSGTNITGFNCLTNNATYTLVLTNHCLFNAATFTGLPNTTTNLFFTLALKQDSAGTWVPKFTNSIIAWAEGVQPVVTTNANAISYLYFHSHLWTNGMLVGTPNLNVK